MKRQLVLVAAVALLSWALLILSQSPGMSAPHARSPLISLEEFNRIRPGMTYDQCVKIIGAVGTPFGSSQEPGDEGEAIEWISYRWRNSPDSYAHVNFHFGKVDRKYAYNLR